MSRRLVIALALASPLLHAADIPQDAGRDQRVQWADYHPDDVVAIVARAGFGTTLVLDPSEVVGQPFVAFPEGWAINVSGHLVNIAPVPAMSPDGVPVEPNADDWHTSLHIQTSERLYTADLSLATPGGPPAAYTVRFRYPAERAEARAEQRRSEAEAAETARAVAQLPAPRNEDYSVSVGDAPSGAIVPAAVYDDGRLTYLRFSGEIPAIFALDAAGNESTVNVSALEARPDVIVVDRLAPGFVLRLGRAVVALYNNRPSAVPALPGGSAVR